VTALGVLSLARRYWQCRCGAEGAYAADAVLGLTRRFSAAVQRHGCRLAADVSFAKAGEHLREMLGVRLAPETLRKLVAAHGRAMAAFQPTDEATARAFRGAAGDVELAVDAGKVNTREDGWKDLKIAVISKREPGPAVPPEQWHQEDRLPEPGVVVSVARITASKVFRKSWAPLLRHLGVGALSAVQALGDGASWIWKSVDRVLTGCTQTLDVYHACERLSGCAQTIFGEGAPEATTAFERGRDLLLADGWSGVCVWVGELLAVEGSEERGRRQTAAEKLLGYFAKHTNRLNYRSQLACGRAIGSGSVEGQAKTLGLRLKARGARWLKKNVRPMASLVCVRNSIQWGAYWDLAA
jgi:hypothetical protein